MDQKIFDFVTGKFGDSLGELGFHKMKEPQQENDGPSAVFVSGDLAYGILYREGKKRFELRSCGMDDETPDYEWKSISTWLFDPATDTQEQAQSIVEDFTETVRGPKQLATQKARKKRKKDDENNVDPLFFFNRFVGVFPELKDELNTERAAYGDVRAVTFAREKLLPQIEALCSRPGEKDRTAKCVGLLNDMYISGDMDVRSLIIIVILNGLSGQALENIRPLFSDELAKSHKSGAKLKGRHFKPEKKKKQKRFTAETLNTLNR